MQVKNIRVMLEAWPSNKYNLVNNFTNLLSTAISIMKSLNNLDMRQYKC